MSSLATLETNLAAEAVKVTIKLVVGRVVEEIKLAWSFNDQLIKLKNKLIYIQAFLEDVGFESSRNLQEKSQLVNIWLQKLKDLAYLADDIIDEYTIQIQTRKFKRKKLQKLLTRSGNPMVFYFRMVRKVNRVIVMLEDLEKEAHSIGLKKVEFLRDGTRKFVCYDNDHNLYQVRKHAAASASEFVGRKVDEEKLLTMLLKHSNHQLTQLSTIAITGMGGLGKTTLARRLYEGEEIGGHFDKKKIWICVSKDLNVERLLKEMVESVTLAKCEVSNIEAIIKTLEKELKGKKVLIILDDVWNDNIELWASLKNELVRVGFLAGSMIVITTRRSEVALKAGCVYEHKLEGLSENDGWTLLKHNVNCERITNVDSFEIVGRKIVNKCGGVPLAIKVIAGLLRTKKYLCEWKSIEKSELWDFDIDDKNIVLPSLLLSFNDLPSVSLKQCFAFCAVYPKDSLLEKDELIAVWLAQGFLNEPETCSTGEEIGERYFDILVNYSFLQIEGKHEATNEIKRCKMHDLMHDLAVYVSKRDMLMIKEEAKPKHGVVYRHAVFNLEKSWTMSEAKREKEITKRLRTISVWAGMSWQSLLIYAKHLRTLIIANIGLRVVPPSIEELKHLRYLDLSRNQIEMLPDSISKLYQLQTLRLIGCFMLEELPRKFHNLVNLRHIQTSYGVVAPRGFGKLTNLRSLPLLELSDGKGWAIDELEALFQVRGHISIRGLEHVKSKEEAKKASLVSKDKISKLELVWGERKKGSSNIDEDVLASLEPNPNIKSMTVKNFKGKMFPSWMMLINCLKVLKLENCSCENLPTLGLLPCLVFLELENFSQVKFIGLEFYVDDHFETGIKIFPVLRNLKIKYFSSLVTWISPPKKLVKAAFACLETLQIERCPRLKTCPSLNPQSLQYVNLLHVGGIEVLNTIKGNNNGSLLSLKLVALPNITRLPSELSRCTNLQQLVIQNCNNLEFIPSALTSLKTFKLTDCPSLTYLQQDFFHGLSTLQRLKFVKLKNLARIPTSLQECKALEHVQVKDCPLPKSPLIPGVITKLQCLFSLTILYAGAKLIRSILDVIPHLPRLQELTIHGFKDEEVCIEHFLGQSQSLSLSLSLVRLQLRDWPKLKSLPQQLLLLHLPNLRFLEIGYFGELEELSDWIGTLSSLEKLFLNGCEKLRVLPSRRAMRHLTRLQNLDILYSPLLEETCAKDYGTEWIKISHIPRIRINYKVIQDLNR